MKKSIKIISIITAMCLLFCSFSACSNKRGDTDIEETEEEDDGRERYSRDQIVPPNYLPDGQPTWFDAHNLEYTPEGNFYLHATASFSPLQITDIPADCRLNEDTTDCEDGYRNVVAIFTIDTRGASYSSYWTSAFDKYTGTSFEFQDGTNTIYNGCHIINSGTVYLHIADYDYTIYIEEDIVQTDDITIMTWTVKCPAEYDGVVFQIGYSEGDYGTHDFSGNTVLYADDFTIVESEYFNYFTIESIPLNKT